MQFFYVVNHLQCSIETKQKQKQQQQQKELKKENGYNERANRSTQQGV